MGNIEGSRNDQAHNEREIARATVVGGRPPQSDVIPRHIPRGLEVLIKKAAVDPKFKNLLLEKKADAANAIGLKLTAAEEAMLAAVPLPHLEAIIAHTRISPKLKPVFLGYAAGAMLAALGTAVTVCQKKTSPEVEWAQNEDILEDAVVEKTIRLLEMPSAGMRPTIHDEKGYVVYVGGDGANDKKRRIDFLQNKMKPVLSFVKSEYDDYIAGNPGAKEGHITARFTVTADGDVENPRLISDSIGSPLVRARVLQRVAVWKVDPIENGDVEVVYKFNFGPRSPYPSAGVALSEAFPTGRSIAEILGTAAPGGSAPAWIPEHYGPHTYGITGIRPDSITTRKYTSPRSEPSVTIAEPGITGFSLDNPRRSPKTIFRITRNNVRNVNNLYVSLLKKNPRLGSGKLVVRYDITPDGRATEAAIISDTLNCAALAGAVLSEISRWEFSQIDEGTVTVVQPFVFIDGNN